MGTLISRLGTSIPSGVSTASAQTAGRAILPRRRNHSKDVMLKRKLAERCIRVVLVAAFGCSVASCYFPVQEYSADYFLEVVNDSSVRIRVQIALLNGRFRLPSGGLHYRSGILDPDSKERITFSINTGLGPRDSAEDNVYVRNFGEIHFYDAGADTPYRSYVYQGDGCGVDLTCWDSHDDTMFVYTRSDGVKERLFVQSPTRPFYLERDKDDSELGRLVITFAPIADSISSQ